MKEKGIMISEIGFSRFPIIFKKSGLDFFILDNEHGAFDYGEIKDILFCAKLCEIKSIVRISDNSRRDIIKFLDAGADALLLPMTSAPSDIESVIRYAKYPPVGKRGISTMRAHTLYEPPRLTDYIERANKQIEIYAQIETSEGVERADEILAADGVSGVFVGPNDLSADYGCIGDNTAAPVFSAIERVGKACSSAGKKCGIITGVADYIKKAEQCNFTALCKGSELNAISGYCKSIVRG